MASAQHLSRLVRITHDGNRLDYTRHHVIGPMPVPRRNTSIDLDAAQTRSMSTCDVRDEVVTHHPTALDEAGSASLGGDVEEASIRLPDTLNPDTA